jgi:carnosine N-methyltransferase
MKLQTIETSAICSSMGAFQCPYCSEHLNGAIIAKGSMRCASCGIAYPVIGGRIPILFPNAIANLACLFIQHHRYLKRQETRILNIRNASGTSLRSEVALTELAFAMEHNAKLTAADRNDIQRFISANDLAEALDNPIFSDYSTTLEYLERDWCWLEQGESEIRSILASVTACIDAGQATGKRALVLGAGMGRIAWELTGHFDDVIALDSSVSMAQNLLRLIDEGMSFYSICTSSMVHNCDMVIRRDATAPPYNTLLDRKTARGGLNYLVGDVRNLPIADGSVSMVASVFFTDVVPLETYIDEVVRVIEPNGLFVHFGPLEYHFDRPELCLSADEIKECFNQKGFETVFDGHADGVHLAREGSLFPRQYRNWVFAARKLETPG